MYPNKNFSFKNNIEYDVGFLLHAYILETAEVH